MIKIFYALYIVVDFAIIHKHPITFLNAFGTCLVLCAIVLCVNGKFLLVLLHWLHRCTYTILLVIFLRIFGQNQNARLREVFSKFA